VIPVSWSLDEKSICKYNCKNNALKLVLDLHTLVPLSRQEGEKMMLAGEKQQMVSVSASSYVPLATNEHA